MVGVLLFLLICIALPFALPTILAGLALIVVAWSAVVPWLGPFFRRVIVPGAVLIFSMALIGAILEQALGVRF